jgi:hypothetical protein
VLEIQQVDVRSAAAVRQFIDLPFRVYRGNTQWVPPLRRDVRETLDPCRHPFYEHSEATFFVAVRKGEPVARIAVLEHRPYNQWHQVRQASFTLFECAEGEAEAARELFARAFAWASSRRLVRIVGPKGFGALDGYGLLIDGFDRRQLMTMTNYNPAWYRELVESLGFDKEVDFVTYELSRRTFVMPEGVHAAAKRASQTLRIVRYPSRRALVREARRIGETYNGAFVNNWEYYPLSEKEIAFVVDQVRPLADPRLMTFIAAGRRIVGFVLAFPDVSQAMQRMNGRLTPWGIAGLLWDRQRTRRVALNGAGILPEYQGRGGNALLYTQIERAVRSSSFEDAELPQVAESAKRMRRDLERLGARAIKVHRVYGRDV